MGCCVGVGMAWSTLDLLCWCFVVVGVGVPPWLTWFSFVGLRCWTLGEARIRQIPVRKSLSLIEKTKVIHSSLRQIDACKLKLTVSWHQTVEGCHWHSVDYTHQIKWQFDCLLTIRWVSGTIDGNASWAGGCEGSGGLLSLSASSRHWLNPGSHSSAERGVK